MTITTVTHIVTTVATVARTMGAHEITETVAWTSDRRGITLPVAPRQGANYVAALLVQGWVIPVVQARTVGEARLAAADASRILLEEGVTAARCGVSVVRTTECDWGKHRPSRACRQVFFA